MEMEIIDSSRAAARKTPSCDHQVSIFIFHVAVSGKNDDGLNSLVHARFADRRALKEDQLCAGKLEFAFRSGFSGR